MRDATGGRPRLGRADRPAAGGRASRSLLADRDHGHRTLHRSPADERRLAQISRVRAQQRGPAGRIPGPRRLQARPGRRGDRRLRGPLPEPGVEGRRAGLPADPADRARRARRGGGQTSRRRAARRRPARPGPLGRLRPGAARSRSANGSRASSTSRRRGRSRTPATSSRRTPAPRSAESSPSGSRPSGSLRERWRRTTSASSSRDMSARRPTRRGAPVVLDPGDGPRPVRARRGAGVVEGGGEDPAAGVVEAAATRQRPLAVALVGPAAVGVAGDDVRRRRPRVARRARSPRRCRWRRSPPPRGRGRSPSAEGG